MMRIRGAWRVGDVVGFVTGEGLLASVSNPDFGVTNDREAIIQVRQAKRLPLSEWANREIAKSQPRSAEGGKG
jgi:hypothetical protein